jgi:DNA processing protein
VAAAETWTIEPGDTGYPLGLADLDRTVRQGLAPPSEGAPQALRGCGSLPLVAGLRLRDAVTIVGARRCTGYGRRVAEELAGSLAAAGLVIVSGLAFGIDAAAHRGALDAGGRTVAVLAGGADVPYPPSACPLHRRLLASGGATVSEHPFGERPARWAFPARNRIMAALSAMTVVVEARVRSGSRITADKALQLGRDVGAVPGPVHSALSAGPHALCADGGFLVTGAQDVLDRVLGVGAVSAERIGPPLDAAANEVLALVGTDGASADAVARAAAVPAAGVSVALTRLELLGYLRADGGRYAPTGLKPPS